MRKITVLEFMSLDGVIQAPGGPEEDPSGGFTLGGWTAPFSDDVLGATIRSQMSQRFDLLLGRKTFEIWAGYWPQHVDVWPEASSATKYVASNTLTLHEWQPSVFLSGDVAARIRALKQEEGPDLHVYGSSILVQTLLSHDLVDALLLKIFPLTLGSGKKLFAGGAIPAAFRVKESFVSPSGVFAVTYERAGAVKPGQVGESAESAE